MRFGSGNAGSIPDGVRSERDADMSNHRPSLRDCSVTANTGRRGTGRLQLAVSFVMFVASLGVLIYTLTRSAVPPVPPPPQAPPTPILRVTPRPDPEQVFQTHVKPVLLRYAQENKHAADRCIERVDDLFQRYKQGVAPFVDELLWMRTKAKLVWALGRDLVDGGNRAETLVAELFGKHVFTADQLASDLARIMEQFRSDIRANQMRMVTEIKAAISASDLPEISLPDYTEFTHLVTRQAEDFAAATSQRALVQSVVIFVGSEVVATTATELVAPVLISSVQALAVSLGARAAIAAGSAGAGAAAGAGGGSALGPAGTAAGFVLGLVVGGVVDWWMTSRQEAQLIDSMNTLLEQVRHAIVEGSGTNPGLRRALLDVVASLNKAQYEVTHDLVVQ